MFFEKNIPFFLTYPGIYTWEQEQLQEKEAKLLKSFYSKTASMVQKLVERECDRMEYEGSMLYDEYPDRCMMELICRRIEKEVSEYDTMLQDARKPDISELVRVLFLNEMYRRRCRQKRCRRYY